MDIVTKSLDPLRLPQSQCHLTTFSAMLLLVTAEASRQSDIVVNDALLVCLGGIQGFTWLNLGSSFLLNDEN